MMFLPLLLLCTLTVPASSQALQPQSNTFNSSFKLNSRQIEAANLSAELTNNVEVSLNYERTNWAGGSVSTYPFYMVPDDLSTTKPGSILKIEAFTNTTLYTLAPILALSRILFATETHNGSTVPASAYVLWPFSPNLQPGTSKAQTVAFAHGNSGTFADCSPSHERTLSYQFQAPFALALAGYAVVAPDYQGLGVDSTHTTSGGAKPIRHPENANPALANDHIYAVQAAQEAFPGRLSEEFVIMGHSEGGGVAWAAAEKLASSPVSGFLGAIAASPAANLSGIVDFALGLGSTGISGAVLDTWGMLDIFPDFALADVLSPVGVARLELLAELGGCNSVVQVLLGEDPDALFQPRWYENYYMKKYWELSSAGGRDVAGPMLVIQGTADPAVPEPITTSTVNATCRVASVGSGFEYLLVNGTTHVPTLYAAQKEWLGWIKDRIHGVTAGRGCSTKTMQPIWPIEQYQAEESWFMERVTDPYETA